MNDGQKEEYYRMVTDCWRLFLKYRKSVISNGVWESIIRETDMIAEKYGNTKFVQGLLLLVMDEIERLQDEKGEQNNGQKHG
ncbi:hypothetical protein BRYFOR_07589 [Marvinbryantia formatexigens DSM 14469]|uniref:Uncharacterized protein n=1 Tax=Marvinbryantia formatexigens DSM 14469 TaxID=478749 RepID=C6LG29_9FIRM|nr:hypothetical protein [Marvinbryantia formatexigens]EET60393.1 hypothetical protein BRYFOR_07589 [Marvinbryantia formatexigens DSM 14469]UWO25267.1 hypothetical protein NQ534_01885 [Marvinbryantia formatexigens DSM 14469]SDH03622.1 hypothetical protein SAMN05660368_03721 [Marvinbryantia formatexigens]